MQTSADRTNVHVGPGIRLEFLETISTRKTVPWTQENRMTGQILQPRKGMKGQSRPEGMVMAVFRIWPGNTPGLRMENAPPRITVKSTTLKHSY